MAEILMFFLIIKCHHDIYCVKASIYQGGQGTGKTGNLAANFS